MGKVVIFGATELAEMLHFYLTHDSSYEVVAFTVDRDYLKEETMCGLPVIPFEEMVSKYPPNQCQMLVAIWYSRVNKTRAEKYFQIKEKGYELISYISSKAVTWPGSPIGDNCIILERSVCQPFTTIGNNVFIMNSCTIGNHSVIKDHCYLAPQTVVLGAVTVEPYCFIGANSTIRDQVTIARECVIGAGGLILENTRERGVYRGNTSQLLPIPSDMLNRI
jgi:sugar O-acyltransferase (sialic acid O-acetyltransferase NeuD family)